MNSVTRRNSDAGLALHEVQRDLRIGQIPQDGGELLIPPKLVAMRQR